MDARGIAREPDWAEICEPIFDASPEPIVTVADVGHIVRFVNPSFCLLVGETKEKLIGAPIRDIMPAADECLPLLERVHRTGYAETHIAKPDSPDALCWSYIMWPVLAEGGHRVGIVIEVTETASFHEQVAAVNQELLISSMRQHELTEKAEVLNAQLRRANEDRKQFAFAVSHDLREPLRAISTYSEILTKGHRGKIDHEASLLIDSISRAAEQMRQLLKDMLAYTTMGEEEIEPAELIDPNGIVQQVVESLRTAIEESSASVTCDDLPVLRGHAAHFVQLFRNLVTNAIKYRGDRPPHIHISAEQVPAGPNAAEPSEWRFSVTDNGMGVDPRYHKKIFEVFQRLHSKAIAGTGMGLAICERVVERYGGRIWVESQVGQGATFYFTLPVTSEKPNA